MLYAARKTSSIQPSLRVFGDNGGKRVDFFAFLLLAHLSAIEDRFVNNDVIWRALRGVPNDRGSIWRVSMGNIWHVTHGGKFLLKERVGGCFY